MNNLLSIDSKIYPKIYFRFNEEIFSNYSTKKDEIQLREYLFDIFIERILNKKINKDIICLIKGHYLHKKFVNFDIPYWYFLKNINKKKYMSTFYHITSYYQLKKIYEYKLEKGLYTVFSLSNNESKYFVNCLINPYLEKYMNLYYVRYNTSDISLFKRIKIQMDRIDKYGRLMKQLFRYRLGFLNKLPNKVLNMIFKEVIKLEPNLGFVYINVIPSNKLHNYIKNIEIELLCTQLSIKYNTFNNFNDNDSDDNYSDDDFTSINILPSEF